MNLRLKNLNFSTWLAALAAALGYGCWAGYANYEHGLRAWTMAAGIQGAYGVRVEKTEDFLPILQDCLARKGVNLIELPVDYSENERVLIQELEQKTCLL